MPKRNKRKTQKGPGRIGSDGLSTYARKCLDRQANDDKPVDTPQQGRTNIARLDHLHSKEVPTKTVTAGAATEEVKAVVHTKILHGHFMLLKAATGELLFLSKHVLCKLRVSLLLKTEIECVVVPAKPGTRYRRVVGLRLSEEL
jgi:hypothetical protein